jgi:hypothetical protein
MRASLPATSLILAAFTLHAATYWVAPTGIAAWTNAASETPLSGAACTSLETAGYNAVAGDLVLLRGGTYDSLLRPAHSGATNNPIVFKSQTNEAAIVSNATAVYGTYFYGLLLNGVSWIRVEGITFERNDAATNATYLLYISGQLGSVGFNEIANCVFDGRYKSVGLTIWDGKSTPHPSGNAATHNWIHGCIFKNTGELSWNGSYVDDVGGMQIGVPSYDADSGYNTIEGCTFYGGGHHNLETFTKYNVIRSNFFHFEGMMTNTTGHDTVYGPDSNGLWGNRNLQIYDGYNSDGTFNLLEGNRFGHSGPPPDDDGGDGLTITAPKNIVRYNAIYGSQNNGVLFKMGASSPSHTNRFYNNTVFGSGRFDNTGPQWLGGVLCWYGSYTNWGTVVKNNLLYGYGGANEIPGGAANPTAYGTFMTNNWLTASGNPMFVSTNIADATDISQPDLRLQSGSGAINAAMPLTWASDAGNATTTLIVDDALYFQDGTWGSKLAGHLPDTIAISTIENRAAIASIDYTNNTITLSSPLTWTNDAPVYLYSKSDGAVVWSGAAPDIGAYEYTSTTPTQSTVSGTLSAGSILKR